MAELQYLIFTVIILALIFDFINGFHDSANAIATAVSTRPTHYRALVLRINADYGYTLFSQLRCQTPIRLGGRHLFAA